MKFSPRQLQQQKSLLPVYHLFGAETLILEEAVNDLRALCRVHGYLEREKLSVETGFNWDTLQASGQALSLFAQKRIIELRMPSGKPGVQGAKALQAYTESLPADVVLIVISGDIIKSARKARWFTALEAAGASIEAAKVQSYQIVGWIDQRLQLAGIQAEPGVSKVIAHYVEGNLLAAAQEINFLALHSKGIRLNIEQVQKLISDQARFTSFAFVDSCLAGQASRAVRILVSLKGEKIEPILIISALSRESVRLVNLSHARAKGQSIQPLFKRLGIWSSRERLMSDALSRIGHVGWLRIHQKLADLDSMLKGQIPLRNRDIWAEIERVGLAVSGSAIMLR